MRYCDECGERVTREYIQRDSCERWVCTACKRVHYENPRIVVCAIITWRDRLLLCKRANEPARHQWSVPLGFLECGESLQQGVARETAEETGVLIDPDDLDLCSIINLVALNQVAVAFRCALRDEPQVRVGPECTDVAFMSADEIPMSDFAWRESVGNGPRDFLDELTRDLFSIQVLGIDQLGGPVTKVRKYLVAEVAARSSTKEK
jgi:ADP-ribose pyrophosphatase YjhB (NUDIX family)